MAEQDLVLHHKVLKQFLEISDDPTAKSRTNSTRAARAREKLLKLSSAQFRELSTDVYDELKRRIDESRGEPDFLLPKSSFHPKRNQARQKLSSLPQSRFKDLVLDISYEIERRELHIPQAPTHSSSSQLHQQHRSNPLISESFRSNSSNHQYPNEHTRNASIGTRQLRESAFNNTHLGSTTSNHRQSLQNDSVLRPTPAEEEEEGEEAVQHSFNRQLQPQSDHQPSIGVQSTTVVPSKANLTWSSDEEDDGEFDSKAAKNRGLDNDHNNNNNHQILPKSMISDSDHNEALKTITSLEARLEETQNEKHKLEEKYKLLQNDYEFSTRQNKLLSKEIEDLSESKALLMNEKITNDSKLKEFDEHSTLKKDYETMKATVGALRLENQALKNSSKDRQIKPVLNPDSIDSTSKQILIENSESIKKELEKFLDQLSNIDNHRLSGSGDEFEPINNLNGANITSKKGYEQTTAELKLDLAKWQQKYEEIRSGQISKDLTERIISQNDLRPFISPNGIISLKLVSELIALIETFLNYLSQNNFDSEFLFDKISKISLTANAIAAQGENIGINGTENSILLREAVSFALTSTRYYATFSNILPKVIVERSVGEVCFSLCDLISILKLNDGELDSKTRSMIQAASSSSSQGSNGKAGVRPLRMANKLKVNQNQNASPTEDTRDDFNRDISQRSFQTSESKFVAGDAESKGLPPKEGAKSSGGGFSIFGAAGAMAAAVVGTISDSKGTSITSEPNGSTNETLDGNSVKSTTSNGNTQGLNLSSNKSFNTEPVSNLNGAKDNISTSTQPIRGVSNELRDAANSAGINGSSRSDIQISRSIFSSSSTLQELAPREAKSSPPRAMGSSVAYLTSKLNSSAESSPTQSPIRKTPTKSSLMDKVKQFESPENKAINSKQSEFKNSGDTFEGAQKGKSFFQSLKDKLTTVETNDDDEPELESETNSKSLADTSTASEASARTVSDSLEAKDISQQRNRNVEFDDEDEDDEDEDTKVNPLINVVKHKVNTVNVETKTLDPPVEVQPLSFPQPLDRSRSIDSRASDLESKASFHSTVTHLQSPQNAHFPQVKKTVNIAEPVAEVPEHVQPFSNAARAPAPGQRKIVTYEDDNQNSEYNDEDDDDEEEESDDDEDPEEAQARQRQEYRKSMAAATFNVDLFDIDDPDNTLTQVLLYLEHQTVQVISTIQSLLSAIKKPQATRGDLRDKSKAITEVISQMTDATNTSMNQTRNAQLKEHGSWVVRSLEDCEHRMTILCKPNTDKSDNDFADKNFKQRLAGISFDIAKCTKELVKTVEEASLKEDIANLDARLNHHDDLT